MKRIESLTDPMARLYKKTRGAEARAGVPGSCTDGEPQWTDGGCAADTGQRHGGARSGGGDDGGKSVLKSGDIGRGSRLRHMRDSSRRLREFNVTPHVAQNDSNRRSAIDRRTTRHEGYGVSQRKRKRVEEVFGWMKTVALQRKTRFRGLDRVGWMFTLAAAAYNLVRMRNLQSAAA